MVTTTINQLNAGASEYTLPIIIIQFASYQIYEPIRFIHHMHSIYVITLPYN